MSLLDNTLKVSWVSAANHLQTDHIMSTSNNRTTAEWYRLYLRDEQLHPIHVNIPQMQLKVLMRIERQTTFLDLLARTYKEFPKMRDGSWTMCFNQEGRLEWQVDLNECVIVPGLFEGLRILEIRRIKHKVEIINGISVRIIIGP